MTTSAQPRVSSPPRRAVVAWAMYDFGNSAFTTLVVTFIYSVYFTRVVAVDEVQGTVVWTRAINISAVIIALLSPILGAIADFSGRRKSFLLFATVQCVAFTALLFFVTPGMLLWGAVLFVVANVAFEGANVFYNAFLPDVSTSRTIGRISGLGWGLGYVGGLLCLVAALGLLRLWSPVEADLPVRATNLLVAAWYAVFAVPLFLTLQEKRPVQPISLSAGARAGFLRLAQTYRELPAHREAAKLLVARLIYNDGLVTIFSFAAIYAANTFDLTTDEILVLGIATNLAAGAGAFLFGFVDDWIGGKRTIALTLIVLTAGALYGAVATTIGQFWVAALLIAAMVGPNQSASRSLLGNLIPVHKRAEFFGFYAFSGKLSAVAGPFLFGLVLSTTRSYRLAMSSIVVFFVVGLALLYFVDESRGIRAARQAK